MEISSNAWNILATQAPFAAIIAALFIYVLKHLERNNDKTIEFLSKQAELNRLFLQNQQDQHSSSTARLAEEIKGNRADAIKELANLTERIDKVIDKLLLFDQVNRRKV